MSRPLPRPTPSRGRLARGGGMPTATPRLSSTVARIVPSASTVAATPTPTSRNGNVNETASPASFHATPTWRPTARTPAPTFTVFKRPPASSSQEQRALKNHWASTPAESSTAAAARGPVIPGTPSRDSSPVAPIRTKTPAPAPAVASRGVARPLGAGYVPGRGKTSGKTIAKMGQLGTRRYRHRKILSDSISGITKPAIRRLARRGGVKRISAPIYDEMRVVVKSRVQNILRHCITYCEHAKRKTITVKDVIFSLRHIGAPIYGFDDQIYEAKKRSARVILPRK
ncbi:histone h4-2 [Drechslerella dactyloides]|uniref:Histone H4 n=1 Tax=Drechslerella dactyloides TaxID=74499 RepID=A0AAD6IVS2_DREDA|nr:histone h4-2 [Drechslerella dactyloides]